MSTGLPMAPRPARQRGAAALVVVMVLFFVVSLVAAYTSRNLIFEQRTSANMARSAQAYEAAEAGLEWALAMLNAGRIDGSCQAPATDTTFRERYLELQPNGNLAVRARPGGGWPTCVFNGTAWQCLCPDATNPALAEPTGVGTFPAFRVRFVATPQTAVRPGTVVLQANGCTRLGSAPGACLDFPARAQAGEGLATVSVVVALTGGLATPPSSPLTARDGIDVTVSGTLRSVNLDLASSGLTLSAGGPIAVPAAAVETIPGTPPETSIVENDPALAALADTPLDRNRLFATFFGVWRETHDAQATVLRCQDPCGLSDLANLWAANPARTVHVAGDLTIDAALGSPANPVLLVVDGNLTVSNAGSVHGLVYLAGNRVDFSGTTDWAGALVSAGNLVLNAAGGTDRLTFTYDAAVIDRLRRTHGSFARVPGSWRDSQ